MELKLDKGSVLLTETVYDGQAEQGVELEYALPDYYPDIFKLLKCSLTPRVVSYSVSENKLFIDGVVYVKVLYLSEGGNDINVIDQRYTYSKTIELSRAVREPVVSIFPTVDYCTARAVSGRRIDIRGAVTLKIKVTGVYDGELLSGVSGMGTQVRAGNITVCDDRLSGGSQYIVREDIETGSGGGITAILSSECYAQLTDTKVISDKVVVKGEARVKALYLTKNSSGETVAEVMEASVPLSRIIDLPGVSDSHSVFASLDIMDLSLEPKTDDSGETRTFGCDMTVDCRVSACKESQIKLVNDLYSTDYESSFTVTPVRLEGMPRQISAQCPVRTEIEYTDGVLGEINDASCEVSGMTFSPSENGGTKVSLRLLFRVTGKTDDGTPVIPEKTESVDIETDISPDESFTAMPTVNAVGVSFGLTGDNTAELRAQIELSGLVSRVTQINAVSEITINEERPKQKNTDYALRIYFAEEGESVWDISKRYNTSAEAIMTENELDSSSGTVSGMLLIPMI